MQGVDWRRVWQIASTADLRLLALCCLVTSFSFFLRAVRWRILLSAESKIRLNTVFWANSAGYLGNTFLPARAGELLRSTMIASRSGLTNTYVLTVALSERLMDALALITIASVVLLTIDRKPAWLAVAAKPVATAGIAGALVLAILPRVEPLLERLLLRLPAVRVRERLIALSRQVLLGIRSLHHPTRLLGFCGLTALIWSVDAASSIIGARALGLAMPFTVALLMLAGLGLGSALPSTPGYVGIYQFVTITVLVPFGFTHTDAIAYSLVSQALGYVVITLWGLVGLWRYNR